MFGEKRRTCRFEGFATIALLNFTGNGFTRVPR
jgi:hypothetical protein